MTKNWNHFKLRYSGYRECLNECCTQPESVGFGIRMVFILPILLVISGLIILWKHPIDGKKILENKEKLDFIRLAFKFKF